MSDIDYRGVGFAIKSGEAMLDCECGAPVPVRLDDSTEQTLVLVECPGCHRKWYVQGVYMVHEVSTSPVTSGVTDDRAAP